MKKFAKIVTKLLILLGKSSIFLLRKRNMNRPIPTLASIPNRLSGKGFVSEESTTDTKTDTSFTIPLLFALIWANPPTTP
jgi:hypothetical protein